MATQTSPLEELDLHFDPTAVRDWAYQSEDRVHPYGAGINYFTRGLSVKKLAEDNMKEARAAIISDSRYSLRAKGLYIGFSHWERPDAETPTQMKFESPVPMDESISGDQPPITGFYPRVVFPPEGEFRYAVLFTFDEGIFGTKFESHELDVPGNISIGNIEIPESIPCKKAIRAGLAEFLKGFDDKYSLPEGEYSLRMEIERMPILALRIDGYRPVVSKILKDGKFPKELPLADRLPHGHYIKAIELLRGASEISPLERRVYDDEKYAEIPFVVPHDEHGKWVGINEVSLEHDGVEDRADLVYVPLRRGKSIEETKLNPNLGLVEVQISRVAKVNGINISYAPKNVERKRDPLEDLFKSQLRDELGLHSTTKGFGPETLGFNPLSTPVNTGRTVFANPRTGPVSPKVDAEWDSHLHTFRFCLTNHL